MWLPIFKSGRHSSDKGTSRTFTEADLHKMADSYATSGREAPLTIGGRTGTADPAYGWVDRLRVVGGVLEAKLKQVPGQLQTALQGHEYGRKSVSLFPDDSIRSITIHGVPAPAVPGLEFSDEGAESYDFADEVEIDVSEIMDRV